MVEALLLRTLWWLARLAMDFRFLLGALLGWKVLSQVCMSVAGCAGRRGKQRRNGKAVVAW
jgi:hypothetical protein